MAVPSDSEQLRATMDEMVAENENELNATPSKGSSTQKRGSSRYSALNTQLFDQYSSTASPSQAKKALEAHMIETNRRLEEASKLGQALVQQKRDLEDRLKEVEQTQSQSEINPELRQKLSELEKEYNEIGRETARVFLAPRRDDFAVDESGAPIRAPSPTKFNARATDSPSKMTAPSRKSRNQGGNRIHDIEFATEISQSLLGQVRSLQAALVEKEEALKSVQSDKDRLESDMKAYNHKLRSLDENEQRYKDENWTLETQTHELLSAQREATAREQRLQHSLAVANAEKTSAQRELDEVRSAHGKLSEELSTFRKVHDSELANVRKSMNFVDSDRSDLVRRIEELSNQNQELADFISTRPKATEENLETQHLTEPEDLTLDKSDMEHNSPPGSPVKGARNSMLESETLKSSLQHAHRMIQTLKGTIHREKTEKLELKRQLQETKDELDIRRQDGGIGSSKRPKAKDLRHKTSRVGQLGSSRMASTEIIEGGDWVDQDGDFRTPKRPSAPVRTETRLDDASEGYATATENEGFATANETEGFETANDAESTDFATGAESLAGDSDDQDTETEDNVQRSGTIRGNKVTPHRMGHISRESFHSTASTSDEDDTTPLRGSRYGSMIYRNKPGGSRWSRLGDSSAQSSVKNSPASFAGAGASLGDELGEFMDDEYGEGDSVGDANTPSRIRSFTGGSRRATPNRGPFNPLGDGIRLDPTPHVPRVPRLPMVDSGAMTDDWAPEPVIKEVPVEVIKTVTVPQEIIKEVPVEVIKEVQVPVEIVKEVQVPVEVIKEVQVPVEVIKEVTKEIEVPKEVIKTVEVPVEVIKTVEVPVEVIKTVEVPVEVIKTVEVPVEVIKTVEVPVDVIKEVIKTVEVPVEVIKEVTRDVIKEVEVPKEVIKTVEVPVEVIKTVEVPVEVVKEVVKEVQVPVEVIKTVEVPVEVIKEVVKEVEVPKEVIKTVEVPVEVIKEVIKEVEVPKEVIKTVEVPVEVIKEVIKEVKVPVEIIKEVEVPKEVVREVEVPREIVKEVEVPKEIIKEVPVEVIKEVKVPVEVIKEVEVVKEVQVPFEVVKEVQVPVEVIKEVQVPVEVIKEVPVEVIKEVKVPVEVIKEIEVPKEVIKEVPVEVIREVEVPKEIIKEVQVEVVKEVPVEVIREIKVPVEVIKEVEVVKEVVREVPVEVVREVEVPKEIIKEVPVEVIREVKVPYEVIKEVEVPREVIREIIKEVPVEVIKEVQVPVAVIKEVIREVPVEMALPSGTSRELTGNEIGEDAQLGQAHQRSTTALYAPDQASRRLQASPVHSVSTDAAGVPASTEPKSSRPSTAVNTADENGSPVRKNNPVSFAQIYTPSNPPPDGTPQREPSRPPTAVKEGSTAAGTIEKAAGAGIIGGTLGWIGGKVTSALTGGASQTQDDEDADGALEAPRPVRQPLGEASNNAAGRSASQRPVTPVSQIKTQTVYAPNGEEMMDDANAPMSPTRSVRSVISVSADGSKPGLPLKSVRRPSSTNSMRRADNVPPLPADHQKVIEAASKRNTAELPRGVVMGPPTVPASAYRAGQIRAVTPSTTDGNTPKAGWANVPRYSRQLLPSRSQRSSRRSSISSFESELDERFHLRNGMMYAAGEGAMDQRMITAITQTMIGEYLWKYTRKAGGTKMSNNRHRRFFWVHPYTRTLYWSDRDPASAGHAQLKAKSVQIEAVRVVQDDNPFPPGLHRKSLMILTPEGGRDLKFTAPTGQRHETWFNSLSYLLLRQNPEAVQQSVNDHHAFNPTASLVGRDGEPGAAPDRASLSTYHSRPATGRASRASSVRRIASPMRSVAEVSDGAAGSTPATVRHNAPPRDSLASNATTQQTPSRTPSRGGAAGNADFAGKVSIGRRISSVLRPGRLSISGRHAGETTEDNSIYNASVVQSESAEDLREQYAQQADADDGVENVRACCDGKHDVGSIPRAAGKRVSHHHHH